MSLSYPLILASASPARFNLLKRMGISCIQLPAHADEQSIETDPLRYTSLVARRKLECCLAAYAYAEKHPVISADTVVSCDSIILGKPDSPEDARKYLRMLSGRVHQVVTGFCLRLPGNGGIYTGTDSTDVLFYDLTENDIHRYLSTGEWQHAAGAYRIQEQGALLVREIKGSFWNVVGLPIEKIFGIVRKQDCLHVVLGP